MKTIETVVYLFNELSGDAREKARNWYREGAFDYNWWETLYEDAERIGLKITAFEIDRYCHGKFIHAPETVAKLICAEHGDNCATTATAKEFAPKLETDDEYAHSEVTVEFLTSLLEDYRILLGKEWEYLNSDEQVDEMIAANEYTFTADGERFG